jgi:tetratricopeptide (TPR) repeat protein
VTVLAGALLGRFALAGDGPEPGAVAPPREGLTGTTGTGTEATVARLRAALRAAPGEPGLLTQLGAAYLTRARESADPSYLAKAADALDRSRSIRPGPADSGTMTALGLLALARHDFTSALAWGRQAHQADPDAAEPLGVIVDAEIELGRYAEAVRSAQRMVDAEPALASLARASYVRQLHGDTSGAITAMEQAAAAGAGSPADVAAVRALAGDLQLGAGRLAKAEAAYRRALAVASRRYEPAEVGLARVAAARGDLRGAAALLEPAVRRLPLPTTVALLGDVHGRLGEWQLAARQYRLVRAIEALNRANGVAVDLELARFEADHARDPGARPERAVALARRALRERPTVYAEDTLAWALRQAGRAREGLPHARAAVRLGTRDALLWYHLAQVEADLGMVGPARHDLARAFAITPWLTVRDQPDALALAAKLGLPPPGSPTMTAGERAAVARAKRGVLRRVGRAPGPVRAGGRR